MDARSRRRFINDMMMATTMAMGGGMMTPLAFGQQAGAPAAGAPAAGQGGRRAGGPARPARPRPEGIVWVSGQGSNDGVPNANAPERIPVTAPYEQHCQYTMDALKRSVERLGGTMGDFIYMQVFFCLPLDDAKPKPKGTALFAEYQKCYTALSPIYNAAFQGSQYGAPPRSCFALEWIPGTSLLELVGAAYIPGAAPARG